MEYLGYLPFTQTTRMEILCINIRLLNLTRWENDPPQSISKSAERTKKSAKLDSPQITAHIFWGFWNGKARTIWFSNLSFRFSHVNGKYIKITLWVFYLREFPSLTILLSVLSIPCAHSFSLRFPVAWDIPWWVPSHSLLPLHILHPLRHPLRHSPLLVMPWSLYLWLRLVNSKERSACLLANCPTRLTTFLIRWVQLSYS